MNQPHDHEQTKNNMDVASPSCCARHAKVPSYSISRAIPATSKDPVCGMSVTAESKHSHEHDGKPYYFCSAGCKKKFTAAPLKYLAPVAANTNVPSVSESDSTGTIYTCPMHPEIKQDHPGDCPKCGMALEPEMPSVDEEDNPELLDFTHRFWWTLPLTVVVTVLAMFGHRLQWFDMLLQSWVELVLTLPIVLWAGLPELAPV